MTTTSGGVRKARPTIIEKLCATVESILDYSLAAVWDMSFQVVAELFDKLGNPDVLFNSHSSEENCNCMIALASCSCIRIEDDFKVYALNLEDAQDLSEANIWLLPIRLRSMLSFYFMFGRIRVLAPI
ncbi:hypothetical protein Tco_0615539 [Tanacetum coccineum]